MSGALSARCCLSIPFKSALLQDRFPPPVERDTGLREGEEFSSLAGF